MIGLILFWLNRPRAALTFFSAPLYGSFFHSPFHIESRYGLIYVPFVIFFSAFFFNLIWQKRKILLSAHSPIFFDLAACILGIFLFQLAKPPFLLLSFASLTFKQTHLLSVLCQSLLLIFFLLMAMRFLFLIVPRRQAILGMVVTGFLILIPFQVQAFHPSECQEWKSPLGLQTRFPKEIFLPPDSLKNSKQQNLRIDLSLPSEVTGRVEVNGKFVADFEVLKSHSPHFAFGSYPVFLSDEKKQPFKMRQWHLLKIPKGVLKTGDWNVIEISGSPPAAVIFGDDLEDSHFFFGPLFQRSYLETSVFKFVHEGDFRIEGKTPLRGESRSSFFDGKEWKGVDLSPSAGIQRGQYRIRIEAEDEEGNWKIY